MASGGGFEGVDGAAFALHEFDEGFGAEGALQFHDGAGSEGGGGLANEADGVDAGGEHGVGVDALGDVFLAEPLGEGGVAGVAGEGADALEEFTGVEAGEDGGAFDGGGFGDGLADGGVGDAGEGGGPFVPVGLGFRVLLPELIEAGFEGDGHDAETSGESYSSRRRSPSRARMGPTSWVTSRVPRYWPCSSRTAR